MYNINKTKIMDYKSVIYISKKLDSTYDSEKNEIPQYDTPIKYIFNIQPVSADSEIREFGELANSMKKIVINKLIYNGKFKEFYKAYIYNNPDGEIQNGANADYRIYSVRPQNTAIVIYFTKLV